MSKRAWLFLAAIYLLILFPVGIFWSFHPLWWLPIHPDASEAQVRKAFVIRLAPTAGGSPLRQHAKDIEAEESSERDEFDPTDWALREVRYRAACCFVIYLAAGVFSRWFIIRVMQGKQGFV